MSLYARVHAVETRHSLIFIRISKNGSWRQEYSIVLIFKVITIGAYETLKSNNLIGKKDMNGLDQILLYTEGRDI